MFRLTNIIYAALLLLIVVEPHFISGHIFFVPGAYAQSMVTVILLGIGYIVYLLHQREIKKEKMRRMQVENNLHSSSQRLSDSYQYIGSLNRQISLLPSITSDLFVRYKRDNKSKKFVFEKLLLIAVTTLANASDGLFRFVRVSSSKTEKEFIYKSGKASFSTGRYGNKSLVQERQKSTTPTFSFQGVRVLSTSDRKAPVQCFFLFADGVDISKDQEAMLRAIVDQAQLFFVYMRE
ncbi:MAG: hypothetical protein PHT88_00500 [Candidatus Moranbacteria bacterium]|nr:hypothetical protein [Candidatus Moranbacteria bacterium]